MALSPKEANGVRGVLPDVDSYRKPTSGASINTSGVMVPFNTSGSKKRRLRSDRVADPPLCLPSVQLSHCARRPRRCSEVQASSEAAQGGAEEARRGANLMSGSVEVPLRPPHRRLGRIAEAVLEAIHRRARGEGWRDRYVCRVCGHERWVKDR